LLFLQGLKESGTVLHAAEFANIHRNCAYDWRKDDPEFRAEWDAIVEGVVDNVERSLYRQAISEKNVVATIFYLKANRPKYRDRVQLDVPSLHRQIEERLSRGTAHPQLSSASTKDIINAALGLKGETRQVVHVDGDDRQ